MSKGRVTRMGERLVKELNDIKIERRVGIDRDLLREISMERLTNGIVKCNPEWQTIKKKLIKEPREEQLR